MSRELAKNLVRLIDDATPYRSDEPSLLSRMPTKKGIPWGLIVLAPIAILLVVSFFNGVKT